VRPQDRGGPAAFAAHARDPRLNTEHVNIGDGDRSPLRLYVHAPCRFEHSIVRRRRALLFSRKPIVGQLTDRDPTQLRCYILVLGFGHFDGGGEQLGFPLCPEAPLVGLSGITRCGMYGSTAWVMLPVRLTTVAPIKRPQKNRMARWWFFWVTSVWVVIVSPFRL
jgi:hypothetical protein